MGFYRVAGRTAWLRASEVGAAQAIEPEHLYRLAATGFCYVDQLSTQAAAGYVEEQSHRSGAKQSRRTELLRLLLRTPQPDRKVLDAAAEAAGTRRESADRCRACAERPLQAGPASPSRPLAPSEWVRRERPGTAAGRRRTGAADC